MLPVAVVVVVGVVVVVVVGVVVVVVVVVGVVVGFVRCKSLRSSAFAAFANERCSKNSALDIGVSPRSLAALQ